MSQRYNPIPLVVIVDPDENERQATRDILVNSGRVHLAGMAHDVQELARYISAEPDIVLLDVGTDPLEVPATIRQVHDMSPRCQVVLTAAPSAQFDLARAMLAGARGVVHKPFTPMELLGVIHDVFEA